MNKEHKLCETDFCGNQAPQGEDFCRTCRKQSYEYHVHETMTFELDQAQTVEDLKQVLTYIMSKIEP